MSLKTATIENFLNRNGFSNPLLTISVKKVIFHYDELRVEIVYDLTPSTYIEGMEKDLVSHSFPINLTDAELLSLILSASDALWERNTDIPLLETVNESGQVVKKSLNELNAAINDVQLGD